MTDTPPELTFEMLESVIVNRQALQGSEKDPSLKLLLKDSKPGLHLSLKHSTLYHTAYGRAGTFAVFPVLYNVSRIVKSPVSNRANRI